MDSSSMTGWEIPEVGSGANRLNLSNRAEVEPLIWPFTLIPGWEVDRNPMVRETVHGARNELQLTDKTPSGPGAQRGHSEG